MISEQTLHGEANSKPNMGVASKDVVKQVSRRRTTCLIYAKQITEEERRNLIATSAYYRAERRNFMPGDEITDWLEAEKEIDERYPGIPTVVKKGFHVGS